MLEQKLEENMFKNINQISSSVPTRIWVFSIECTRTWPSICKRIKKWWWFPPVCFLVDVVLQRAWVLYRIKKDEGDEPLPVPAFRRHIVNAIFLKYSKEGRSPSNHLGIRYISSDVCYGDTKHYQVQSEHRCIQNLSKHLRGSVCT